MMEQVGTVAVTGARSEARYVAFLFHHQRQQICNLLLFLASRVRTALLPFKCSQII